MATSGTNNTVSWTLANGTLRIYPSSGTTGTWYSFYNGLFGYVDLTTEEVSSVRRIVFEGSIYCKVKEVFKDPYTPTDYSLFFGGFDNVEHVDVRGLKMDGATEIVGFFELSNLKSIDGLSSLPINSISDFSVLFRSAKLTSLDLSSWDRLNNRAAKITGMFDSMRYCSQIKLPSSFTRPDTDNTGNYRLGLANSTIQATNVNGITVASDEDFFSLPSRERGGVWTRDISQTATLIFEVKGTTREGQSATLSYSYETSTATLQLYLKQSSESSWPSSPAKTIPLNGIGTGTIELTGLQDSSYDVQIIVTDGETTIYTYPTIDSNIRLLKITDDGNVHMRIANYQTTGNIDKTIYDALNSLGWLSDCVERDQFIDVSLDNHGSWVDSGQTVDGKTLYQSNGSYHVGNAWDTAKITFSGYESFALDIRSYAEGNYDYVLVSQLNNDYLANCTSSSAMRSAYSNSTYTKAYTRGKQSATNYEKVTFTGLDPSAEYYFYIIFQKDGSGDSNDDRGYFYIES